MKIKCIEGIAKINTIFNLVKILNNESTLTLEKERISIRVLDKPNVMLVNIIIDSKIFEEYVIDKEVSFNIDFEILSKIINSMKSGFTVEDKEDELVFDSIKKKIKRSVKKYVGAKDERQNPPSNFINKYTINLDNLVEASELVKEVSDVVKIVGKDNINISGKGNLEKIEIEIDGNNKYDEVILYLSANYLNILSSLKEGFDNIDIEIQNGKSFYFNCNQELIKLEGWIALRVEE